MDEQRDRRKAVVALLHSVRNRRALARNALVAAAVGGDATRATELRAEVAAQLPAIVEELVQGLGSESEQNRRRFDVLRRSDIARERHDTIARDIGLSRSQFYRDLHEARDLFVEALEDRLAWGRGGSRFRQREEDSRFVAIEALRRGGRYDRACEMASQLAGTAEAGEAIRALCMRADLENELGCFAAARRTAAEARALLPFVTDEHRALLDEHCTLLHFEAAYGQGLPASEGARLALINRLRARYGTYQREYGELLIRALIEESSILFDRGNAPRAQAAIAEASAVLASARVADTRLSVDVKVRASGIHALQADRVSAALNETAEIVEMGGRCGDVRSLRMGMQMMSAHLLTLGRLEEARRYALEARALIDLFGSTLDRVIVLSNLARIDILRRDGVEALRWIRMARALSCDAFAIDHALAISETEALVLVNQAHRAVGMATALSRRVHAWPRLFGRAKLAEAISLAAAARRREARESSDQAVELSRQGGSPLLQLKALELNARLTGSGTSRAALRDLQAALTP
jgi:predicted DNA-binding protein (UPF0251 family)